MTADPIRRRKVSAILRPLSRTDEDDMLNAIRPSLYASHVPENFMDFGLSGAAEERRRIRRERLWRHCYRAGIVFVMLAIGFIAGYNVRLSMTEVKRRAEVIQDQGWTRIAYGVQQGKRRCAMDWREGCLVCQYRSLNGTSRSTMC
jgi:hypothetical protein